MATHRYGGNASVQHTLLRTLLVLWGLGWGVVPCASSASTTPDLALGASLWRGQTPLHAKLRGHEQPVPDTAARCAQCHEAAKPGAGQATRLGPRRYGPLLTPDTLTQAQARRGGPPSTYNATSFCQLLRTGVDPAGIVLAQSMPQYALSGQECEALWQWLMRPSPRPRRAATP